VRQIPLSQGLVALVDDQDASRVLAAGKWHAQRCARTHYARRTIRRDDGKRTALALHRFITGWDYVDHINGDGLDNRRGNLRPASHEENVRNRRAQLAGASGYKGVDWDKAAGAWRARITANGRLIYLGRFVSADEAARAYDAAARDLHGSYARLNYPEMTA
jgi:hypothetical protein